MTKSRTSNSSVCRVHKNANYTVMSNYHLQSRNLSLKAIGLLSKVFSLPDDWDYSIAGLTCICKENETAIKSALNELKEWGYLTVTKLMPSETKSGRIEYVYDFYEYSDKDTHSREGTPVKKAHIKKQEVENPPLETSEITSMKQEVEKQEVENLPLEILQVEFLPTENQGQLNTKESITKKQSTNYLINQSLTDDEIDKMKCEIENRIGYKRLVSNYGDIVDGIVDIMLDVYSSTGTVQICNQAKPIKLVQRVFDKLDEVTVEYVLDCFKVASSRNPIRNIKKYLLAALYNAPMTSDAYYSAEVNYDYGGTENDDYGYED
ncbi:DUF6017 domain-containing protein [Candidatus Pseudoruminococcus sp.]|uniref:DUF6017 domain-containing protein n=1 Tax=Candidatus Pseudoruminococcus sp. TaxID=3101048 RepID=UPI00399A1ADA